MIKAAGFYPTTLPKSISQGPAHFPGTSVIPKKHLLASNDIRTIKIYILYRDTSFCFWVVYFHMIFLNTSNVSADLILTGREFQIFGPREVRLFVPNS